MDFIFKACIFWPKSELKLNEFFYPMQCWKTWAKYFVFLCTIFMYKLCSTIHMNFILKVDLHVFTLVSLMIIKTFQVKLSVKKIVISHLYRHQLKSFADRPNHAFSMNFQQNNSRKSNNPFNLSQSKYLVLSISSSSEKYHNHTQIHQTYGKWIHYFSKKRTIEKHW